jgi:hypothetical protein
MRRSALLAVAGLVGAYQPFVHPPDKSLQLTERPDPTQVAPGIFQAHKPAPAQLAPDHHGLKPPEFDPGDCRPGEDNVMRCWATHMMARDMPGQYLCNVSDWPKQPVKHPALDPKLMSDFLLPPKTHLLLFGNSHVRSVRHVLVSAAELHKQHVNTTLESLSDDCDDSPDGLKGAAMLAKRREQRGAGYQKCGLFEDRVRNEADLIIDEFLASGSSITTIVNHRQYQLPENADRLSALLKNAKDPFTHGYFTFPHDRDYFDAHCNFEKGGAKPDPLKVGDGAAPSRLHKVGDEAGELCKVPDCVESSPLFQTIRAQIPNVGFRGGVAIKHDSPGVSNSSMVRIHKSYADNLLPRPPDRPAAETRSDGSGPAHACNAICKVRTGADADNEPAGRINCHVGEGVAVAWEVLRSAGLVQCPPDWSECEPLDNMPMVKSWLWRSPRSYVSSTASKALAKGNKFGEEER